MIWETIVQTVGNIFKPAADLVDNLHTSQEEKDKARNALESVKSEVMIDLIKLKSQEIELQGEIVKANAKIIESESSSKNWLQSSWRPVSMMVFVSLIVLNYLGILKTPISEELWILIQVGFGVYTGGRSLEKVSSNIMNNLPGRNQNDNQFTT